MSQTKPATRSLAERFAKPAAVSNVDVAFPTDVRKLLPPYSEVPDDFKRFNGNERVRLAASLFCSGGKLPATKPGIDRVAATRHLQVCLSSWEPKHEHKEAGVAYLLSLWCTEARNAS